MSENQNSFKGQVTRIGSVQTGTSKAGKEWSKQDFTIEEESGEYPQSITIDTLKTDKLNGVAVGDIVHAFYNVESKEYNGRHFNSISLWKCDIITKGTAPKQAEPVAAGENKDDLPF